MTSARSPLVWQASAENSPDCGPTHDAQVSGRNGGQINESDMVNSKITVALLATSFLFSACSSADFNFANAVERSIAIEEGIFDETITVIDDPEAGSHVKVNAKGKMQAKWGYQAFVNIDEDGFIFATACTPGNEHEINSLAGLLDPTEDMLFADSAYSSQKIRDWMAENDIQDRVQRKGYRNRKLSVEGRARNVEIGVTRGRVEAIFGHMKRLWGMARSRFMGLKRTHAHFQIAAIGWNLQKGARFRRIFG